MRNEASVSAFSPLHRGRVDDARVQIRTVERCDSLWIIHDKNHTVGNSRERAMNRSRARSMGKVHPLDTLFLCLNIRNLPQISQSCTESCARATYVRKIAHHHQPLKSIFTCTITVRRNSAPLTAFVLNFFFSDDSLLLNPRANVFLRSKLWMLP